MRKQAIALVLLFALAACGGDDGTAADRGAAVQAGQELPAPDSEAGDSVTGMPPPGSADTVVELGPGDGSVRPGEVATASDDGLLEPGADPLAAADPGDATLLPPAPGALPPDTPVASTVGTPPAAASAPAGSGASGATATVRDYYAAISAGNYAAAHRLWSGDGSASGQSLQQFASGFADTADVRVHLMEPETAGSGAAGSQYIRVPVTLDTTRRDGSRVQFTGSYTLRRPSDGSGDWRIDSADLRQVQR